MEAVCSTIYELLAADHPMTCRQVFYRLVSAGVIPKTEAAYKGLVVRKLGDLRRAGRVPFGWIADNTRWQRKPRTHSSVEDMLAETARTYRRALWDTQDVYVEIWLEKDALSSVIMDVTSAWDVPLMVTRGYPSLSFLHSASEVIGAVGKPTRIFYLGDWDPSGVDIPRVVEERLREFASDAEITFERVAVGPDLIAAYDLPTRPTKKSDSRSRNFEGESVEVDALPPRVLRQIVQGRIESCIDWHELRAIKRVEEVERESLYRFAKLYPLAGAAR